LLLPLLLLLLDLGSFFFLMLSGNFFLTLMLLGCAQFFLMLLGGFFLTLLLLLLGCA
jgi:hypothetical protein